MLTARATGQSARFWDGEEHCESRNNRTHHETQDLRPAAVSHPHRLPLVVAGSAPVGIPLWAFLPSLPCFSSPKRSRSVGPRLGYEVQTVGQPPICNSAIFPPPHLRGVFIVSCQVVSCQILPLNHAAIPSPLAVLKCSRRIHHNIRTASSVAPRGTVFYPIPSC